MLWLIAVLGMLWADVSWLERLRGLAGFHKLLVIPLLLVQFSRSAQAHYLLVGFLFSCTVLLIFSWASVLWPAVAWGTYPGVPVERLHCPERGVCPLCIRVAPHCPECTQDKASFNRACLRRIGTRFRNQCLLRSTQPHSTRSLSFPVGCFRNSAFWVTAGCLCRTRHRSRPSEFGVVYFALSSWSCDRRCGGDPAFSGW